MRADRERRSVLRRRLLRAAGVAVSSLTAGCLGALDGEVDVPERFRFETDDAVSASPTIVDGTVYVGSQHYAGENMYAIDASDGTERWAVDVGTVLRSAPAVAGDTVYVGENAPQGVVPDGDESYSLYALDRETGEQRWKTDSDSERSGITIPIQRGSRRYPDVCGQYTSATGV